MTDISKTLLLCGPRIAGLVFAGFLTLFALDVFIRSPFVAALPAFAIHLIPSLIVLTVVAIAWRFDWIGAASFIALAVVYAVIVGGRVDWIAAISGPLVIIGLLFLASWRYRARPTSSIAE